MKKEKDLIKKNDSDGLSAFVFLSTFLGFIGILGYLVIEYLIKKPINNSKEKKIAKGKEEELQKNIQEWFNVKIDEFEKDCLAYGIEVEADKAGISIFKKEELRKKYGKVLLIPSLSIYSEYRSKFGIDYSKLDFAIHKWLENQSGENSLKQIEQFISERSYKKAKQILLEIEDNKSND